MRTKKDIDNRIISPAIKLQPNIITTPEIEQNFSYIRQGTATNDLTKAVTTNKDRLQLDQIADKAVIIHNETKIDITNISKRIGARASTFQLLDALTMTCTANGAKSSKIELPLRDYMELRDVKDVKSARSQINEDLETLYNISLSFKQQIGKDKFENYRDIRLIQEKGIENSIIKVNLGDKFYNYIKTCNVMSYPKELFRLDNRRYPHSYAIGRKIAEHKNMNVGKQNEDIIAVKTLLKAAQGIPSYEEVMDGDKAVNRRIIDTLEKALDGLEDILSWEYCKAKGEPLEDEELSNMTYSTFKTLLIRVIWKCYPSQELRLERKQEKIDKAKEKAKQKPRRRRKKKE